jgi:hypothetical protein
MIKRMMLKYGLSKKQAEDVMKAHGKLNAQRIRSVSIDEICSIITAFPFKKDENGNKSQKEQ